MSIHTGIIYIRLQLLKCGERSGCACDYSEIEVSVLLKQVRLFK